MKTVHSFLSPQGLDVEIPDDWSAESLSDWLQNLSVNNLGRTCETIHAAMRRMGSDELSAALRLQAFEMLYTKTSLFDERTAELYLDEAMPLSDYSQYCVKWLTECYKTLASACSSIVADVESKQEKALALLLALNSLICCYRHLTATYSRPFDGFWIMCYRIYAVAEKEEVLDLSINIGHRDNAIIESFKCFLLYSLCDSQQFRPREMRQLFVFLGRFSGQLALEDNVSPKQNKGVFIVNFDQDIGPVSLMRNAELKLNPAVKFINAAKLAKSIHQSLIQEDGKNELAIKPSVLMRMLKTLAQVNMRQYKRTNTRRECRGVIGFSHIKNYLYQKSKPSLFDKPKRMYEISQFELVSHDDESMFPVQSASRKPSVKEDVWEKIQKASANSSKQGKIWDVENKPVKPELNHFRLINTCANGYGLSVSYSGLGMMVGDLLAIVQESSSKLELAIIRRMRRAEEGDFILGVELIGIAEEIVSMESGKKRGKAILLPGLKTIKQPDMLVYNSAEFKRGDSITLTRRGQEITCRLQKILNSNSSFNQAELSYSE